MPIRRRLRGDGRLACACAREIRVLHLSLAEAPVGHALAPSLTQPPPERGLIDSLLDLDGLTDSALEKALDGAIHLVRDPLYRAAATWLGDDRLNALIAGGQLRYP